ncbi:hypothetical protein ACHAWT_001282 [Skeletonema menzelii]
MESSWKLTQPKSLCSSTNASNKRGKPGQWDVSRGDNEKNNSRSFSVYVPPNFCSNGAQQQQDVTLRIILATHGYGGKPAMEIRKWQDVADAVNAIIIAPMGTGSIANQKLGWNAVECCGDPVLNETDDLDFVLNGVMEVFLHQLGDSSGSSSSSSSYKINSSARKNIVHVIATGFSNGGFFTSLLGVTEDRPDWLVGIVPTGGYQYDINAYSNTPELAVFMHHGGKDSVVNPNGCCIANEPKQRKKGSKSNCMFDIGVKQGSCQSVQSVFHLWTRINGCSSDHRSIKEGGVKSIETECFAGKDCIEPTNFCIWTNEGHSWGGTFPGIEMMQPWMEDVFVRAEKKRSEHQDAPARSNHRIRMGRSIFLSASLILFGFIALSAAYLFLKRWNCMKISSKRKKNSEDRQMFKEEEMTVVYPVNDMGKHTTSVPKRRPLAPLLRETHSKQDNAIIV